ncbi:hypothetical protein ANN_25048 [Periplaneta americana]|uniref:Uncharacterized protein n=1 Tax=Periplaneta americana TaxID=6978 RepID=A0ABQ8S0G7_PERAM|nr:hypothetical protein ANN_25048 [Periplaneta americana]
MSPESSTESYPAFARIGLRENPGKNLNQFKVCHGSLYAVMWLVDEPRELNLPTLPQRCITCVLEKLPRKYCVHYEEYLPIQVVFKLLSIEGIAQLVPPYCGVSATPKSPTLSLITRAASTKRPTTETKIIIKCIPTQISVNISEVEAGRPSGKNDAVEMDPLGHHVGPTHEEEEEEEEEEEKPRKTKTPTGKFVSDNSRQSVIKKSKR